MMTSPARPRRLVCEVFDRAMRRARKYAHWHVARRVLATPPVIPRNDGVIVLSMIGTRTLIPYLVAIKSFHHRLAMGRIVLIDDGSLTDNDRRILTQHCGAPHIIPIATIDTGDCPRGGTWERLLTLLDLRADHYVVQLDSDTVTLGDIAEVRAAIADNHNFMLLGGPDSQAVGIQRLPDFVRWKYPGGPVAPPAHMQALIESRYAAYPDADRHCYVRASSGFAGFARDGASGRREATTFSRHAERLVGMATWSKWGSEQVTSNFLLANEPDTRILPYSGYYNYWRTPVTGDERLVHFVGTHRYSDGVYRRMTAHAIDRLKQPRAD
ncbi:hypothetical protein [Sphingomonas sp. UMB7805-LC452B]|nr:hypothetical protein [Sphingomonas sp. UMB7805-LC452B]MBB4048203.1 hypothetical protein [Sphingomonas zeae]MDK8215439.1 hypothetical protein [Sphingomonas sp. UMB7805-LC452B]